MNNKTLGQPDNYHARDAKEIASRALALFGVIGVAFGAPRKDVISWLKEENLWDKLSPYELAYLSAKKPTRKQTINFSWESEALIVLLWALAKVEKIPEPDEQCDTSLFQKIMPPYSNVAVEEFVSSAERRAAECLLDMAGKIMQLHILARQAKYYSKQISQKIDIEIIQERHHAINWVVGYEGLPWDEVTTDT